MSHQVYTLLILLLLLKKAVSARLRESDIHPISLKTPAPQYQPVDRKKRKGKTVEDYFIIIKKGVGSARLTESGIHPISPKTPAPQYQPIDRKKRKGY